MKLKLINEHLDKNKNDKAHKITETKTKNIKDISSIYVLNDKQIWQGFR